MPHYELSSDQEAFVSEAKSKGLKVDYNYSNRFLKGGKCPAVKVESLKAISFRQRSVQWDKVSDGYMIYAPF